MTEIRKQAQLAQEPKPEEPRKAEPTLDEKQLDAVTGGTKASPILMQACATGVHLKDATITH